MMKKHKIFITLLLISSFCISKTQVKKCVRGANQYGFFAQFLWTLNHLEYCKAMDLTPVIYWGPSFAYYKTNGYNCSKNGWEYYFEPVSNMGYQKGDRIFLNDYFKRPNNFSAIWYYVQYIDNIHLLPQEEQKAFKPIDDHHDRYTSADLDCQRKLAYPVGKNHLYDKGFRKWINENLIAPYIKIKTPVLDKIDNFYNENILSKKTIGIHLRGTFLFNEVIPVTLDEIFAEANKYAEQGYQFYVATDQLPLIKEAEKKLNGPVLYYPCQRFDKTTSPFKSQSLDPQLGEDLLIETLLLSKCDHLIHTLSNVSTAVLYFNPKLEHTVLY